MKYQTVKVSLQGSVCNVQFDRPVENNTINDRLVEELHDVLTGCEESATVVVLSGSAEVFCLGGDFAAIADSTAQSGHVSRSAERLYDLWLRLALGPCITVANVRGKVNAGGVGFVAACDIALADETARFSLSELLFGVYPACVFPFLVRRVGAQRAHYLTLTTHAVTASQAKDWGLLDAVDIQGDALLRRHLLRLRRLSKIAIRRYKNYASGYWPALRESRERAIAGNVEVFADPANIAAIARYVEQGFFPWEHSDVS